MNDPHDELLQELLASTDKDETDRLLADHPELRPDFEAMQSVERELQALGKDERELLARAESERLPAAEDQIEAFVRRQLGEPSRRINWVWVATAAAAAAIVGLALWLRDSGERTPETPGDLHIPLGDGVTEPPESSRTSPQGRVRRADFTRFEWANEGARFRVSVYARESGDLLLEGDLVDQNSWTPTAQQRATLRGAMTWELEIFALGGTSLDAPAPIDFSLY